MKKILSVLLAIALLAGIMPLAMADENVPEAETPVQAEEQAQEEAVVPFTGRLTLFNCRPLIHGEMAYLKANVENANKSFSIFWDKLVHCIHLNLISIFLDLGVKLPSMILMSEKSGELLKKTADCSATFWGLCWTFVDKVCIMTYNN